MEQYNLSKYANTPIEEAKFALLCALAGTSIDNYIATPFSAKSNKFYYRKKY